MGKDFLGRALKAPASQGVCSRVVRGGALEAEGVALPTGRMYQEGGTEKWQRDRLPKFFLSPGKD